MRKAGRTRLAFKKLRLFLFLRSYPFYRISQGIRAKYKFDNKLKPKELRSKYFNKKSVPEISKLSRTLSLPYKPLWEALVLDKTFSLTNKLPDRERIKVYFSVENELIQLSIAKQNQSDYADPDYDFEFAFLSVAIERAVGNRLINIQKDSVFNHQFEVLQKFYLRWYYKVAYKYKLPTTSIVPFVWRLIS